MKMHPLFARTEKQKETDMIINLHRVGINQATSKTPNLPRSVRGQLKSFLRSHWPVRVLLPDGSNFETGSVVRVGTGWILTKDMHYAVSLEPAAPSQPAAFTGVLKNHFDNEAELETEAIDLGAAGEELRDSPVVREHGYPEFISSNLGFALNEHAEIATEGEFATQDAQRVIVAALSSQAADILECLHAVDYRERLVIIPTTYAVRGVDTAVKELSALAVYARGRVIHCLPSELAIAPEKLCAHIVDVQTLAAPKTARPRSRRRGKPAEVTEVETHSEKPF